MESDHVCPVCLDERVSTMSLKCGHFLCASCAKRWFPNLKFANGRCPICRAIVTHENFPGLASKDEPPKTAEGFAFGRGYFDSIPTRRSVDAKDAFVLLTASLPDATAFERRVASGVSDMILIEIKWAQLTPKNNNRRVTRSLVSGRNDGDMRNMRNMRNIVLSIVYDPLNEKNLVRLTTALDGESDTVLVSKKLVNPIQEIISPLLKRKTDAVDVEGYQLRPIHAGATLEVSDVRAILQTQVFVLVFQ